MIAQAMIEEVPLPADPMLSGEVLLPVSHDSFHSGVGRKSNDSVQMVWHQQHQSAMPDEMLVIVSCSAQNFIANASPT
jgi:hypothetical protein